MSRPQFCASHKSLNWSWQASYNVVLNTSPLGSSWEGMWNDGSRKLTWESKTRNTEMFVSASSIPLLRHRLAWSRQLIDQFLRVDPGLVVFSQRQTMATHRGLGWSHRLTQVWTNWWSDSRQMPPEKASRILKARVLFSVVSSLLTAFRMPTIIAKINISPIKETRAEMFKTRFRDNDSSWACSFSLIRLLVW